MSPYGDFTVQRWSHQPWVTVWDPQGFQDVGCHLFLSFWAWQDVSPRRLRRWAHQWADVWTWLRIMGYDWTDTTPVVWRHWALGQLATPVAPTTVASPIETLYRFYAFWHGYDPQRVPQQPWPRDRRERERWLVLLDNP